MTPSLPRRLASAIGTIRARENVVVTHAIAFNFLVCLFPFLFLVMTAAERVTPGSRPGEALSSLVREMIPFGGEAMTESLRHVARYTRRLQLASIALIIWGSSGIFIPLEMALKQAWGGELRRGMLPTRLFAIVMTMAGSLLALVSLALTVWARGVMQPSPEVARAGMKAGALVLTYLVFFLMYRFVPKTAVPTPVALRAALWGGTAWELVKYAFVASLARRNLQVFYGQLAFAVALVLWAYVSSLVLFFGALMAPRRSAA
jgi:membrane protein